MADSIKIRVENMEYNVTGGEFRQLLAAVKALPKRRFVSEQKVWVVDGSLEMVRGQIENSGYILEGGTPVPADATPPPGASEGRIKIKAGDIEAVVTGNTFQAILTAIKAIDGRRFDGESKTWQLPGAMSAIKARLEKEGFRLEDLRKITPTPDAPSTTGPAVPPPPPPVDAPPFSPDMPHFSEEEEDFWDDEPLLDEPDDQPPAPAPTPALQKSSPSGRQDRIRVVVDNQPLVVVGGTFQEMLAAVKDVPGRRFDGNTKQWQLGDDIGSVQQHLNAKGFRLEEA